MYVERTADLPAPSWAAVFATAYEDWLGLDVGDIETLMALEWAALASGVVILTTLDVDLGGDLDGDHNFQWPGVYLSHPDAPDRVIAIADSHRLLVAKEM